MKKLLATIMAFTIVLTSAGAGAADNITMYAPDGRSISVLSAEAESYNRVGWYYTPVTTIFAPDGRKAVIEKSQLKAYENVGWAEEKGVTLYSTTGESIYVWASEAQSYRNLCWHDEHVTKLYAQGGKTAVVALSEVATYRQVGWQPIHSYIMENNYEEISKNLAHLQFDQYWPGVPYSGDVPRTYYKGVCFDSTVIDSISFDESNNFCRSVCLYVKDVFPYLRYYADANGNITLENFNQALCETGLYGTNYYRSTVFSIFNYYSPFGVWIDDTQYIGDFDGYMAVVTDINSDKTISLNHSKIVFSNLT